jgi:hypothetical protein
MLVISDNVSPFFVSSPLLDAVRLMTRAASFSYSCHAIALRAFDNLKNRPAGLAKKSLFRCHCALAKVCNLF